LAAWPKRKTDPAATDIVNTVDLSNVKPSPEGEGWVRKKSEYG